MFWAAGRCPLAYSAGVRTSSTIVPGAFMAVEKPLAVMCCPVAGHVVLPADLLEEQALTPAVVATATMASAAAAIQRTMIGWGAFACCLLLVWTKGLQTVASRVHFREQYRALVGHALVRGSGVVVVVVAGVVGTG